MKKALAKIIAASVITSLLHTVLPVDVPSAQAAVSSVSLSQGMSGEAVSGIQRDLKILGYFTYPSITGYFGSVTAAAVKSFQQAYGLQATGIADNATLTAIAHALVKRSIVADSYTYLRAPYLWGGVTPSGFDCSGFVYYMFQKHGVPFQRTSSAVMATMGSPVDRSKLMPGDWVFFALSEPGIVSHVGIYVGNGEFISATRSAGVYVQRLDSSYWGPRYTGARRFY